MIRHCPRCGDEMETYYVRQTRCRRCDAEVARILAADAKRRAPRFPVGKDLSTWTGKSAAA